MKRKIKAINYNPDRKSVTIEFNKGYGPHGLGASQIGELLLKFHNKYDI